MDPLNREDSSRYTDSSEERTVAPQPVQLAEPPIQKKSRVASVLALLLVLALALAVVTGWLWYQQSGRVGHLETDLSKARNDVARLESTTKAETKLKQTNEVTTDTNDSQSDAVVKAALLYMKARVNTDTSSMNASVEKQVGNFAVVSVGGSSSGALGLYLKEVNNQWIVIGDSGSEHALLETQFGLPKNL